MTKQLFALTVTAVGEVRDKDGNLLNTEPVETTIVVDEEQLAALVAAQQEGQDQ